MKDKRMKCCKHKSTAAFLGKESEYLTFVEYVKWSEKAEHRSFGVRGPVLLVEPAICGVPSYHGAAFILAGLGAQPDLPPLSAGATARPLSASFWPISSYASRLIQANNRDSLCYCGECEHEKLEDCIKNYCQCRAVEKGIMS